MHQAEGERNFERGAPKGSRKALKRKTSNTSTAHTAQQQRRRGDMRYRDPYSLCSLRRARAHATCHMHMLCYMRQRQYMSNEQYYIADSRARAIGVSTGSHSRSESTHSPQVNVNMQVGVGVGFGFWLLFCAWRWAASGFRSSSIFSMFFAAIYTFLLSTFWLQL